MWKPLSPVFFKEAGQIAQSPKIWWMKAAFLGVELIGALIVFMLSSQSNYTNEFGSGRVGLALFVTIAFITLFAVLLVAPLLTAGAVCGEREAGTLELLFMTRLSAWNIVQDKGLSRMLCLGGLCLLTLPFMAAALMFGGVEPAQLLNAAGNIAGAAVFCAAVSLWFSTALKRYAAALAASYCVIFAWVVFMPILAAFIVESTRICSADIVACGSPLFSLALSQESYLLSRSPWLLYSWAPFLGFSVVLYLLSTLAAARKLARGKGGADAVQDVMARRKALLPRLLGYAFSLKLNAGRRDLSGRRNPIAWREGGADHVKRVFNVIANVFIVAFVIASTFALCLGANDSIVVFYLFYYCGMLFWVFQAAIASSRVFAKERQDNTFDILLTTRLKAGEFVWGAFVGCVRGSLRFALLMFLPLVVAHLGRPLNSNNATTWGEAALPLLMSPPIILASLLFICAVGVFCSMWAKTQVRAMAAVLVVVALVFVVLPVVGTIFLDSINFLDDPFELIAYVSPAVWLVFAGVVGGHVPSDHFTSYFVVIPLYLALAAAILRYAAWRFRRLRR